jgi:hypothetical protein
MFFLRFSREYSVCLLTMARGNLKDEDKHLYVGSMPSRVGVGVGLESEICAEATVEP